MNYANAQAFAMHNYDEGHPGDSAKLALIAWIPRAVWPNKPIIESGVGFHERMTGDSGPSFGVGFFAEAYWNGGWALVILVSAVVGWLFATLGAQIMNGVRSGNLVDSASGIALDQERTEIRWLVAHGNCRAGGFHAALPGAAPFLATATHLPPAAPILASKEPSMKRRPLLGSKALSSRCVRQDIIWPVPGNGNGLPLPVVSAVCGATIAKRNN